MMGGDEDEMKGIKAIFIDEGLIQFMESTMSLCEGGRILYG